MTHPTKPVHLWAACVLPGDGPEYRFTAALPRNPLRRLLRLLRGEVR